MVTFDTLLKRRTERKRCYYLNYIELILLLCKFTFSIANELNATDESEVNHDDSKNFAEGLISTDESELNHDDDSKNFSEGLILTDEKTKLDWIIGGICFGIGFLCVLAISYLYRKKIRYYCKKCFRKRRKLDPDQIDAEHLSSLDSLILSSQNKSQDKTNDDSDHFNSPDFDDFADLMAESFTKKTTERQEMERRFGQPLL